MPKFIICCFLIFSFLFYQLKGQLTDFLKSENISLQSETLYFKWQNSNFIKNNEYFNNIVEGYTLIGYWAEPSILYQISDQSKILAGVSISYFSGKKKFHTINPVFTFTHEFSKSIHFKIGSLPYSQYDMPYPILNPERYYLQRNNNGLEFSYNVGFFKGNSWLSWDQFIFFGDSIQESITTGNHCYFIIGDTLNTQLRIPIFMIITHRGGQINRPKKPIETLTNTGSGLIFTIKTNQKFIESINFSTLIFYYKQLSSYPYQPFKEGWAIYPFIKAQNSFVILESGYWYSNRFIAPKGEIIYSSISTYNPLNSIHHRKLFFGKIGFQKKFKNHVTLQFGFEGYYFNQENLLDYNFYLHLNWQLLTKLFRVSALP